MTTLLIISLFVLLASPTFLLYAKVKQIRTIRNQVIDSQSRHDRAEKERRIQEGNDIIVKVFANCEAED